MKVQYFVMLFLLVFLSFCVKYDVKQMTLVKISTEKQRYDSILESAVNDAADVLVSKDRGNKPKIEKERALETLFDSMYAGFGILHDETAKQELEEYIPLILFTDRDGFYLWYHGEYEENGRCIRGRFSEKYPYSYCFRDPDYKGDTYMGFTIDDVIYLVENDTNLVSYGTRQDLSLSFPRISFLKDEQEFEEIRRKTMIHAITETINTYINTNNLIAGNYGITYECAIPYLDDASWARTIDDIAIVVFFQGYPYGNRITETYNQYEIGGARVNKNTYYYIKNTDGTLVYHRNNCEACSKDLIPYDSKRECACMGAYPCKKCRP
ncbi:MAG: hypothetical protein ACERKN_03305 [Velocimicrobium sp.]